MNSLENIVELLDSVLPSNSIKTVMFCEVEQKAYEIFYYSFFRDGTCKQCYDLASENVIEESMLDNVFERIAEYVRELEEYDSNVRNVVTIMIEGINEITCLKKYDKSIGLYSIKKEWKDKYLK